MIPNPYDVQLAEERYLDLRRDAAMYRLMQASRVDLVPGPSLLDRVRPLLARLHLAHPVVGQAKLPA